MTKAAPWKEIEALEEKEESNECWNEYPERGTRLPDLIVTIQIHDQKVATQQSHECSGNSDEVPPGGLGTIHRTDGL